MAKGGGINAFTDEARKLYTAPQSCQLSNLDEASGFWRRLASWTKLQEASCLTRSRVVQKLPTEAVVTFNTLPQHRFSLSICILTIPSCLLNSSNFAPLSPLVNMSAT